ncbi:MAG: glycosyltransferase [Alphaproteobacteria bacterium]|nr:glycosyltransferase [Alphaproteobacteria bacterium]MCW5738690.1 glycosyltransferase [Alphaproteobacteria bacterium]
MTTSMVSPSPVLFVTRYYRPELIGSAPFTADMAEFLAGTGRDVTVVTGLPHYPMAEVFPDYRDGVRLREEFNGVRVERVPSGTPRRPSAAARIANEVGFLLRGLGSLAIGRFDRHRVVLALCPSVLGVALGVAARSRGGVCVAIVHDIQSGLAAGLGMVKGGGLAGLMRACERLVLNRVDLVVVLSQEMGDHLRRIGVTAPIEVVPLWVDTDRVRPAGPPAPGPVRILYSGNFGRKQGLGQVIALAELLMIRRPDIEVVLRGSGSQIGALAGEVERLGLHNIRLSELQPDESLGPALATGDVHLVPQNPDAAAFAVPSKAFNIMAVGRPFVATALPGTVLWRLREATGAFLCVPPNDPEAFAAAVLRLADDPGLRDELGRRGRRFVERHCAKPKVLGDFVSRLDALSAGT